MICNMFSSRIQDNNPQLIADNLKVFKSYNVGDKVIVEYDERTSFGIVHGFTYNSVGELVVYVDMVGMKEIHSYLPSFVKVV